MENSSKQTTTDPSNLSVYQKSSQHYLKKHNKIPSAQHNNHNALDLIRYFETCKEGENMICNQEISQTIEKEAQTTEVMVLADKGTKQLLNIFHVFKNVI